MADKELKETTVAAAAATSALPDIPELHVTFSKPFNFEGETYDEVNLSGIAQLQSRQLTELDEIVLSQTDSNKHPMLQDDYMYALAHLASDLPVELFERLPMREMRKIGDCINDYVNAAEKEESLYEETPEYLVKLADPIKLNGQTVTELDLSGLEDLNGLDKKAAERYVKKQKSARLFQRLGMLTWYAGYHFCLAAMALHVDVKDVEQLSFRDAFKVRIQVLIFLGSMG